MFGRVVDDGGGGGGEPFVSAAAVYLDCFLWCATRADEMKAREMSYTRLKYIYSAPLVFIVRTLSPRGPHLPLSIWRDIYKIYNIIHIYIYTYIVYTECVSIAVPVSGRAFND